MLEWRRITDKRQVAAYLAGVIAHHLGLAEKVLWFLPGGSAMEVAIETSQLLAGQPLDNLTVTLTDERYGPVGHKHSNWQQLVAAGLSLPAATLRPFLSSGSLNLTAEAFAKKLEGDMAKNDFSLALTGIGTDGHIFGIKPDSPGLDSPRAVVGYKWSDYNRITLTAKTIQKIDEVVVYAVGQEKRVQLDRLEKPLPPAKQPAQLLKQLNKVIIFNDYKGERS